MLIMADELFGEQGEVAVRCAEMLLCRKPNRPMQFSLNAPLLLSMSQLSARASSDIIGKQAGSIVLGLGLGEMKRERGCAAEVAKNYESLVSEIVNKTQSRLLLVTIPRGLLPEVEDQVDQLNQSIEGFASKAPGRIIIVDFARHAEKFKEMQAERGKFARSIYSDDAKPTSLCLTLLSLFLQDCILQTMN